MKTPTHTAPPVDLDHLVRGWEFDSHLDVTNKGQTRLMQVWSRPSKQWADTRDWAITEDTPGKEHPPKAGCGHWASTDSFKKAFPHFERSDSSNNNMICEQMELPLERPPQMAQSSVPCWKGWSIGDRVLVLDGMIAGTIFRLPPKMSPHWRATVNFDQPDEHGHDCCFCTQDEMIREESNSPLTTTTSSTAH